MPSSDAPGHDPQESPARPGTRELRGPDWSRAGRQRGGDVCKPTIEAIGEDARSGGVERPGGCRAGTHIAPSLTVRLAERVGSLRRDRV
jgi:hypothetical protein